MDADGSDDETSTTAPTVIHAPEHAPIDSLRPHPRNYHGHPADQLTHLHRSLQDNGMYRNIVVANDGTILAGHGVVMAARKLGYENVPVVRMPFGPDDPRALRLLIGDNEIERLAFDDDRALTEMLRELGAEDITALVGTGFDEKMLTGLLYATRTADEIGSLDEAAEWIGMPEYGDQTPTHKMIISFRSAEDRAAFAAQAGVTIKNNELMNVICWWPPKPWNDIVAVKYVDGDAPEPIDDAVDDPAP
jgi:hypothetical protein